MTCNNYFRLVLVQFVWLLISFFFSCGCVYFLFEPFVAHAAGWALANQAVLGRLAARQQHDRHRDSVPSKTLAISCFSRLIKDCPHRQTHTDTHLQSLARLTLFKILAFLTSSMK